MTKIYDERQTEVEEQEEFLAPSRSQKKREAEALQDLGKELTRLAPEELARIDLPEKLTDAIADYKTMKSFGAQRRQLQLIGRYMRELSYPAVREAIDRARGESKAAVAAQHRAEKARDTLIAEDSVLTPFLTQHPDVDRQALRTLIRAARKEKEGDKPPKSARELYRMLYAMELPNLNLYLSTED